MKILVITNLYPPHFVGGYELGCRDVVEQLRRRGHTVWVSEDDFVNGHMEGASDSRMPTVDGVHLPQ